jgi:hypothetical protein
MQASAIITRQQAATVWTMCVIHAQTTGLVLPIRFCDTPLSFRVSHVLEMRCLFILPVRFLRELLLLQNTSLLLFVFQLKIELILPSDLQGFPPLIRDASLVDSSLRYAAFIPRQPLA